MANPDDFRGEAELACCRSWLDDDEAARAGRYLESEDRHLFVVSHGLLRYTLARYVDAAPERLRFTKGEHGRPGLEGGSTAPPLGFSLSHTRGLVACVISDEIDVGVDVEGVGRVADPRALAARYFSSEERDELTELPDDEVDSRFATYWALKEAWLKARGLGLELPLDAVRFAIGGAGESVATFDAETGEDEAGWQFARFCVEKRHVLALAVRRLGSADRPVDSTVVIHRVRGFSF